MALKIGVQLPPRFDDPGEYLADARALDAAGADSLWLGGDGDEPWLLLAAFAAVTGRARLVASVSALDARTPGLLEVRTATLGRLSRGRVVLSVGEPEVGLVRSRVRPCHVIAEPANGGRPKAGALSADGVVVLDDSVEACRSMFDEIGARRRDSALTASYELWARIKVPDGRPAWRTTLRDYEAAGATGVLVPADVRLLDLLRNADEDDDRSDLILSQG